MSRKKLALIIALIVAAGAIASGIVYAQEASTPQTETLRALLDAELESSQEPGARNFSFFLDGGAFLGVGAEDIGKENMTRYGMREDAMQRLAGLLADANKGKTVTDAVHALRASYSTLQYV